MKIIVIELYFLAMMSCFQYYEAFGQKLDIELNKTNQAAINLKNINTSTASATYMNFKNDQNALFQIGITGDNNSFFTSPRTAYLFTLAEQSIPLVFATNGLERMRIGYDGKVRIGPDVNVGSLVTIVNTDSIDLALNIHSSSKSPALSIVSEKKGIGSIITSDSTTAMILISQNSEDASLLATQGGNGPVAIFNSANGSNTYNSVEIENSGNAHALFIKGTAMRQDASPNWNTTSDIRLKKEIKPFEYGLEIIAQINPVSFRYNGLCGLSTEKENVGIIAQEIEKIAPYMISKRDMRLDPNNSDNKDILKDVLTYDPNALSYILVNAVKKLKAEKIEQQKIIAALQEKIEELINRTGKIENYLKHSLSKQDNSE